MPHLLVVDAGNVVMRAYHGMPADQPDHHVDGFRIMLLRLIRDWQPTHVVVALDCEGPSFRADAYPEYKANRVDRQGPTPDELVSSLIPALERWNVLHLRVERFEGDDLMATLARRGFDAGSKVSLVTNDSDVLQAVKPGVQVLRFLPGRPVQVADEAWIAERYGLTASQIADMKALAGDSSDNIPRVGTSTKSGRTVGYTEKLACEHLRRFGNLEGIYEAIPMLPAKYGSWLEACRETCFAFRDLIHLRDSVSLDDVDARASHVSRLELR